MQRFISAKDLVYFFSLAGGFCVAGMTCGQWLFSIELKKYKEKTELRRESFMVRDKLEKTAMENKFRHDLEQLELETQAAVRDAFFRMAYNNDQVELRGRFMENFMKDKMNSNKKDMAKEEAELPKKEY